MPKMRPFLLSLTLLVAAPARAQTAPLFVPPDGATPRRLPGDQRIDCGAHGAFAPPPRWSVVRVRRDIHMTSPTGRVRLIRARARLRSSEDFIERVEQVVAGLLDEPASFEPAREDRHGRWRADRQVRGLGERSGRTVTIEAWSERSSSLWIVLRSDDAAPGEREAAATARASWQPLVSHACLCGYDCGRRSSRGP